MAIRDDAYICITKREILLGRSAMNYLNLVSSVTGLVHLVASMLALLSGTFILLLTKGTMLHKKIGYTYTLNMAILLTTAFMIYNLFGSWGIFHWSALISTVTLLCGFIPILTRRPAKSFISLHSSFMYWSVVGLYAAFVAESLVRIPRIVIENGSPNKIFYYLTGIGVGLTFAAGVFFFLRQRPKWSKQFGQR